MPFKLEKSGNGYFVIDDDGKRYSEKPLSKKRAGAQMRALYANVPDAKEVSSVPTAVMAHGQFSLFGGTGLSKIKREKELDLTPPQGVMDNVRLGVTLKENGIGVGTGAANVRAESLLSGETQEPGTIYRMSVFFNRNRAQKDDDRVSWLLMGGDAGDAWTKSIVKDVAEIRREKYFNEEILSMLDDDTEMEGEPTVLEMGIDEDEYAEIPEESEYQDAGENNTGVMIAFFVAPEHAEELASSVPDPVNPDNMHITLAYLGDIDDGLDKSAIISSLGSFVNIQQTIVGRTNGFGRFHGKNNEEDAIYASFDAPELPSFRQSLVDHLANCNIQVSKEHGFTPHITLSYIGVDDETPDVHIPDLTCKFDTLWLAWGNEHIPFKLPNRVFYAVKEFVKTLIGYKAKKMKRERDGGHPASHYLVVEDPEKASTWHLPVYSKSGELDKRRMGAAWAALHEGYRGNKYEGPKKGDAIKKLTALYEQEGMTIPGGVLEKSTKKSIKSGTPYVTGEYSPEIFVSRSKEFDEMVSLAKKVEKGGSDSGFMVYKQNDGAYRWLLISSNAFRDRDGEIVSTKALVNDCERADTEKDYGPLRWWHVPGIDIGQCDFNMVHGRMLIESGTFDDPEIGERVKEEQDKLEISIGFTHPSSEPDSEGVFNSIRRFERSLVPKGRVSNRFTAVLVQ